MPKTKIRLTETQIRNFKPLQKAYKKTDDDGLVLLIRPTGTKVWQYRYRFQKKANIYTIGQYPEVGVSEARQVRDKVKKLVRSGVDPNLSKKEMKKNELSKSASSFRTVAEDWLDKQVWVPKHTKNIRSQLERDVLSVVGHLQLNEIKPLVVVDILKSIERRGAPDVAKRTGQHMSAIYEYAINHGLCDYNPASGRSKIIKSPAVSHRPHLSSEQLPDFLQSLENYVGTKLVKLAMKLLMLTMVRPGELRHAKWDEVDEENAVWRIPSGRMKMRREHIVPLSSQALDVLREIKEISGKGNLIFPGNRSPEKPISDVTLIKVIKTIGFGAKLTPHGMRGTASTILNERGFRSDVIERQLAHIEQNKIRGAYNHAEYLDERRKMLSWWGSYLSENSPGGVFITTKAAVQAEIHARSETQDA
jgi:integrase